MQRVRVKRLDPNAMLPTVAHPGEDLAYDVYALEEVFLPLNETKWVRTGIAMQAERYGGVFDGKSVEKLGLIVKDRSSMAGRDIVTRGGVIDAGYIGEIKIAMTQVGSESKRFHYQYRIAPGDKIAQLIPIPVLTGDVIEVDEFEETGRGGNGFGSSGR